MGMEIICKLRCDECGKVLPFEASKQSAVENVAARSFGWTSRVEGNLRLFRCSRCTVKEAKRQKRQGGQS